MRRACDDLAGDVEVVQYVPRGKFLIWLVLGWELVSDFGDVHHGEYSVLMRRTDES